jgi:hypothetical protein
MAAKVSEKPSCRLAMTDLSFHGDARSLMTESNFNEHLPVGASLA